MKSSLDATPSWARLCCPLEDSGTRMKEPASTYHVPSFSAHSEQRHCNSRDSDSDPCSCRGAFLPVDQADRGCADDSRSADRRIDEPGRKLLERMEQKVGGEEIGYAE